MQQNPYSPPGLAPSPYGAYAPAPTTSAGGVTEGAVLALTQTRPWVRLIAVFSLIAAALLFVLSAFMLLAGAIADKSDKPPPFPVAALALVYLPFAALYVYPGIKLWMYANAINRVEASRAPADLEAALVQQKSFWKYAGIATIVTIVIYVLALVVGMAVGIANAVGKS
jgi:hypothetical protein